MDDCSAPAQKKEAARTQYAQAIDQILDLQTTFEWAIRDRVMDARRASVCDQGGEIACFAYGTGATIIRLNKGLRRGANRKMLAFRIDPISGYWVKNEDEESNESALDPTVSPRKRIVPCVQKRKNALLF